MLRGARIGRGDHMCVGAGRSDQTELRPTGPSWLGERPVARAFHAHALVPAPTWRFNVKKREGEASGRPPNKRPCPLICPPPHPLEAKTPRHCQEAQARPSSC